MCIISEMPSGIFIHLAVWPSGKTGMDTSTAVQPVAMLRIYVWLSIYVGIVKSWPEYVPEPFTRYTSLAWAGNSWLRPYLHWRRTFVLFRRLHCVPSSDTVRSSLAGSRPDSLVIGQLSSKQSAAFVRDGSPQRRHPN